MYFISEENEAELFRRIILHIAHLRDKVGTFCHPSKRSCYNESLYVEIVFEGF